MSGIKPAAFRGGIHPLARLRGGKDATRSLAITPAKPPETVVIPMSQHIGAPCEPCVKKGDRVLLGQLIGSAKGHVSSPVHSSVSGDVLAVEPRLVISGARVMCAVIKNDFQDERAPLAERCEDTDSLPPERIIEIIRDAGIVGLGGAAFPTHVKLSPPPGTAIDLLLINGAECEPFLTGDHRIMLERAEAVTGGIRLIMRSLGVKRAIIGIERNKMDTADMIRPIIEKMSGVSVVFLPERYPQGSEKHLISALAGREVPSGALPAAVGCIVVNVSTAAACYDAAATGQPLIDAVVTVAGAVKTPKNLLARVGTSAIDLINDCGGLTSECRSVISGGPMMGMALFDLSVPIQKSTSGIIALSSAVAGQGGATSCIRCARCAAACPMRLQPMMINRLSALSRWDAAAEYGCADCVECGSCAYVCPAKLNLTTNIRVAKREVLARRARG